MTLHDLGAKVSENFVNLVRNLVSGGDPHMASRKFESAALVIFEGVLAAASHKNPFSSQQREGIVDRRMIYVPFPNRVKNAQVKDFKELFPIQEIERLAAFALQQDDRLILKFIRTVNEDPQVRQNMLESFKENPRALHGPHVMARKRSEAKAREGIWVPSGPRGRCQKGHLVRGRRDHL